MNQPNPMVSPYPVSPYAAAAAPPAAQAPPPAQPPADPVAPVTSSPAAMGVPQGLQGQPYQPTASSATTKPDERVRIDTPAVTISYPKLFVPQKKLNAKPDDKLIYSAEFFILDPGSLDAYSQQKLQELFDAVNTVATKKFGANWQQAGVKSPFRSGGEKRNGQLPPNALWFRANTTNPPGVITGQERRLVLPHEADIVYAGCSVIANLTVEDYDMSMNRGVKFYLNHVWKIGDGERLGGEGGDPEHAFDHVDMSAIPFNYEQPQAQQPAAAPYGYQQQAAAAAAPPQQVPPQQYAPQPQQAPPQQYPAAAAAPPPYPPQQGQQPYNPHAPY